MLYVETNSIIRLSYKEAGQGRPLVLIPGWTTSSSWWQKQVPVLSKHYRIITVDPRGNGHSEKTLKGQRLSRHAHDIHDLLEHLNLMNVTLVGWSVGASVLFSYLDLFGASRLRNVVFVDMTPRIISNEEWKYGQAGGSFTLNDLSPLLMGLAADQSNFTLGFLHACFYQQPSQQELNWMLADMLQTPTRAAIALLTEHSIQDWRDVLPAIQLPVLVIAGKHSPFPYQSGAYIAEHVGNGQFLLFEESGHCPFYEQSEKFNDALITFAK